MLKKISVLVLTFICLTVCYGFMRASKSRTQEHRTTVMDYPKAFHGREPIKITALAGWTFEIKNVSSEPITRFTLHFVAGSPGFPLHGPGAHQHKLPVVWGEKGDKLLLAGESTQISAEENIDLISKNGHVDLNNTEIWPAEVIFEGGNKMWSIGKFYKKASPGKDKSLIWEADASLNPILPRPIPNIDTGRCWDYELSRGFPTNLCIGSPCPSCKFTSPQFKRVEGGYPLIVTCAYCMNEFFTVCQAPDGSACTRSQINDLDLSKPCE